MQKRLRGPVKKLTRGLYMWAMLTMTAHQRSFNGIFRYVHQQPDRQRRAGQSDQALVPPLQECGVVNRVTILTDKFGGAKGYAYIEFEKADAAISAVLLEGSSLRNREIKVTVQHMRPPNVLCSPPRLDRKSALILCVVGLRLRAKQTKSG